MKGSEMIGCLIRKLTLALGLSGALFALSACDPNAVPVSGGAYYDSVLWNDYYYGGVRPSRRIGQCPDPSD